MGDQLTAEVIRSITTVLLFVLAWLRDRVPKTRPQKSGRSKGRKKTRLLDG